MRLPLPQQNRLAWRLAGLLNTRIDRIFSWREIWAVKAFIPDPMLYEQTCKPEYHILTFGCGNGDGTGLFVSYPARRDCGWHFPATRGDDAVAKAKKIAIGRRDFNSVRNFKKYITVYEGK